VKRIQLIGQPREFRGQAVTINGFVRDVEARRAAPDSSIAGNHSTGDTTYYILWVQPSESNAGPYCVYCLHPPAELPRTRDELADYQWMATINGIFFKNRSYQATDQSVQYSPLLLTDSFALKPPISDHPALKWKLSPTLMAGLLALVPLLAVGIVWYAVRSTVSRKRLPSKKSEEELEVFLGDLKNDPSIKTDLEQIQAISEHSDDISRDIGLAQAREETIDYRFWLFRFPAILHKIERIAITDAPQTSDSIQQLYRCSATATDPSGNSIPCTILTRSVPNKLPKQSAINTPIQVTGLLYCRALINGPAETESPDQSTLVFIADRLAWYPTSETIADKQMIALASLGFDVGQLDQIKSPLDHQRFRSSRLSQSPLTTSVPASP